jgi:hypothetical protein
MRKKVESVIVSGIVINMTNMAIEDIINVDTSIGIYSF